APLTVTVSAQHGLSSTPFRNKMMRVHRTLTGILFFQDMVWLSPIWASIAPYTRGLTQSNEKSPFPQIFLKTPLPTVGRAGSPQSFAASLAHVSRNVAMRLKMGRPG